MASTQRWQPNKIAPYPGNIDKWQAEKEHYTRAWYCEGVNPSITTRVHEDSSYKHLALWSQNTKNKNKGVDNTLERMGYLLEWSPLQCF